MIPSAHYRAATAATPSYLHKSPWSRTPSPPSWALNRTHTAASSLLWFRGIWCILMAHHHSTFTASAPPEPGAVVQIFGVSDQICLLAGNRQRWWSDQKGDILWHLCYIVVYLPIMGRQTKMFSHEFLTQCCFSSTSSMATGKIHISGQGRATTWERNKGLWTLTGYSQVSQMGENWKRRHKDLLPCNRSQAWSSAMPPAAW